MYPILGRYGPYFFYSFTAIMGLGVLAGVALSAWQAQRNDIPEWSDALLVSLSAGLISSRLGFVATRWEYFQHHLAEIGQIWLGGLTYHGLLFGGLLALWGWSTRRKKQWQHYAGLLAPGIALAATFGWLACWMEGCAYGRLTILGPLAADLPDELGVYALRYRTQQIGLILSLFTWLAVMRVRGSWSPARLFWLALFGLSLSRFLTSLLRGDPVLEIWQLRVDTLVDAALTLTSLILLQYNRKRVTDAE
jgi:phosphatidylglycerol:prolipoprotein diacylglycerol transferase